MTAEPEKRNTTGSLYNVYGKRVLDLIIAGALCIVLSPVLLMISVLVALTGSGSVIFKQKRYGQDGKTFQIYKFRTMTVSEDGNAFRQAVQNDQRVTRFGSILRRTSLDELPQLINILNGTMSIIGPRPHPTALDEMYEPVIPGYDMRFTVKPGITGQAQIRGQRGPTETISAMSVRIASDIEYAEKITLAGDIKILLSTIKVVFRGTNAL